MKYNLGSAGIILALPGVSSTLWKKFQIGFGFNRIKNYNNMFNIEGRSNGSTIGSAFAESAEGLNYNDANSWPQGIRGDEAWIGWESYLIDPKEGYTTSYKPALSGVDLFHASTVTQKGGNDELIFSLGSNYDDKIFLGATIGVPFINFTENRTFSEVNDKHTDTFNFQRLKIVDKLNVRATGINLKLGIIYQPFNFIRVGLAFHTPTYYGNVRDYFERQMEAAAWEKDTAGLIHHFDVVVSPLANKFNYSLTTPLRAMANVAFFIQQRAFISAEYEFANYGSTTMYSVDYNFVKENNNIRDMYGFCHIFRLGAELSLNQVLAVRAGYNYISSPYKENINDGSKHYISLGLGFRTRIFYGDFAYAITTSKTNYWMFNPLFVNAVQNKYITHKILLTLGVRF